LKSSSNLKKCIQLKHTPVLFAEGRRPEGRNWLRLSQ
jgi:hypothetical protein